jgi:hypothetical protein
MKDGEMKNYDQHELAVLQRHWKVNEEKPSLADLELRVRAKMASRRRFRRIRLFIIVPLWTSGAILMATYHRYLGGNLGFLVLAVILFVVAAWLGSGSGPDQLAEKPQDYVKLRVTNKTRQLRRARIAFAAFVLFGTLFVSEAHLHKASWRDEFLPMGVLLITLATVGGIIAVRGSARNELARLRQLEKEFESLDEQLANSNQKSAGEEPDQSSPPQK